MRRLVLPMATAAAVSCNGDGGGPASPAFEATACSLLWYRARPAGRFDLYKLEMPAADWVTGAHAYDGTSRLGVFYYGLFDGDGDGLFEQYLDAGSATSGDFTLTVEGVGEGDPVVFTDSQVQSYLGLGRVVVATGGTGGFNGVWSPPEVDGGGDDPVYADPAAIGMAYAGSNLSLGSVDYGAFGLCWDDSPTSARSTRFARSGQASEPRRPTVGWRQPLNKQ